MQVGVGACNWPALCNGRSLSPVVSRAALPIAKLVNSSSSPTPAPAPAPASAETMSKVDLSEVPVEALLKEVSRRLECAKKPERRLILIGARLGGQRMVRGLAWGTDRPDTNARRPSWLR